MDSTHTAWTIFGFCVTGFLFLVTWVKTIDGKTSAIGTMQKDVLEIKEALLGTMDKKGIITKIHDHSVEMESLRSVCAERHK